MTTNFSQTAAYIWSLADRDLINYAYTIRDKIVSSQYFVVGAILAVAATPGGGKPRPYVLR